MSSQLPPPTYLFLNNSTNDQGLEQKVDKCNAASLKPPNARETTLIPMDVENEPQGNFVT